MFNEKVSYCRLEQQQNICTANQEYNGMLTGILWIVSGHYTDIHSRPIYTVNRAVRSPADDDGHYTDIHSDIAGRVGGRTSACLESAANDHDHYIDIDAVSAEDQLTAAAGSVEEAVSRRGYEGLDPLVIPALQQPQRPQPYAGLATTTTYVASTQQGEDEEMEMTDLVADDDTQNTVSSPALE